MRISTLLLLLIAFNLKGQDSLSFNKFSFALETRTGTQFGRVDLIFSGSYKISSHIGFEIGYFRTNQLGYWDTQYDSKNWKEHISNYSGFYTGKAMYGNGGGFIISINEFSAPEGKGFSKGIKIGYMRNFEVSEELFLENLVDQWYLQNATANEFTLGIECLKNIKISEKMYCYAGVEWMFSIVNLKGNYEGYFVGDPFNGDLERYQMFDPQLFLKIGVAMKI